MVHRGTNGQVRRYTNRLISPLASTIMPASRRSVSEAYGRGASKPVSHNGSLAQDLVLEDSLTYGVGDAVDETPN